MSSMEQAVTQKLISSPSVTTLVGTSPARIQWDRRPQANALPSITLSNISGAPLYSDEGSTGLVNRRVQIDCWANDSTEAKSLAYAVGSALKPPKFVCAGFRFEGCDPENTIDFVEQEQGEIPIFRRMLEYQFWFYEEEI
jgi:hypothetical protein